MVTASVHEAKTHLSRYLTLASGGEDVVIMRWGKPVARLVPVKAKRDKREGGRLRGQFSVADDFYETDDELAALFNS
jgi:prevent-host-death family protein